MYRINNQKLPGSIGVTMTSVDAETHIEISKEYKVICVLRSLIDK